MLVAELYGERLPTKEEMEAARKLAHDKAFYHHYITIYWVKHYLGKGKMKKAIQEWDSIPQDDLNALWLAPTKGGCLTTKERAQMREGWTQRFRMRQS